MKKPISVLVCGGRNYHDWIAVESALDYLGVAETIGRIIEGGANGADELARGWAKANNVPCFTFRADWEKHGNAAVPIRNQQMLDEGMPDVVVAFPGGAGTNDMVARAGKVPGIRLLDLREFGKD